MKAAPTHAPLIQFPAVNGHLQIAGRSLQDIAMQAGQTPFYVYDRAAIHARIAQLRDALPSKLQLHYAIKANPMPALLASMVPHIDGFDVASAGELAAALAAGMPAQHISFAGPGKREAELEQAVRAGVLINVESWREVDLLARIQQTAQQVARIAVRVNPDFELKSSGMKMAGGAKPFGVDAEQVPALLAYIGRLGLAFEGFHIFAGSQNLKAESIIDAQAASLQLATRLAAHAPAPVRTLNLGGGFGIPYFPGEQRLELSGIGASMSALLEEARNHLPAAQLVIELGRFIVGEAGAYVTRILDRKESRGTTFLVTDGGLHHHLAASGNFGQVIRKNYPVHVETAQERPASQAETVTVVGPLCTPLDILAERIEIPFHAQSGDFVVILQSGAYGASASPQSFLSHPPPVELLV